MRPAFVARQYFRTWFCLDVSIVSADWFACAQPPDSGDNLGALKVLRSRVFLRILRLGRLLRLLKLLNSDTIKNYLHNDSAKAVVSVALLVVMVCGLNHYIACGWYALGSLDFGVSSTTGQINWTQAYFVDDASTAYRYLTCLHWAFAQFTTTSTEVYPFNTVERMFAITATLIGMLLLSTIISNITSAITTVHAQPADPPTSQPTNQPANQPASQPTQ